MPTSTAISRRTATRTTSSRTWEPHVKDWKPGDPTWQDGKGKGIIGAINYLASQGMNVFSFLTLNIEGDDRNVFPYTDYDERERIDCSRMDQWAIVFEHGNNLGMYLHFKTMETENELLLDKGDLGPQRKLYYRELIARFGHNLALNWNLGEEINDASHEQKVAWANYFWTHDPYQHHIVIHNMGDPHYDLLGDASALTGFSLQTSQPDFSHVHDRTLDYIRRSVEAGKPWVVACDEPGDATHALITDAEDPDPRQCPKERPLGQYHGRRRRRRVVLRLQASAQRPDLPGLPHAREDVDPMPLCPGVLRGPRDPLLGHDERQRQARQSRRLLPLLRRARSTLSISNMAATRRSTCRKRTGCSRSAGSIRATGGPLLSGSTVAVAGGGKRSLGQPPRDQDQDWLALVRPADPNRNYPPAVNAGGDQTVMLPRGEQTVTIELEGNVNDDGKPGDKVTCKWAKADGPGAVEFEKPSSAATSVSLTGAGTYVLKLTASDGEEAGSDSATIIVEPFSARVVRDLYSGRRRLYRRRFDAEQSAPQGRREPGASRISSSKSTVSLSRILDVSLQLTEHGDTGSGTLRVYRGSHTDWTGATLTKLFRPRTRRSPGRTLRIGRRRRDGHDSRCAAHHRR